MGQVHIQTRVPDEINDEIEKRLESGDFMNRAEVVRYLLRAGIEADQAEDTDPVELAVATAEHQIREETQASGLNWVQFATVFNTALLLTLLVLVI